jgi:hypothetical protein
MVISEQLRLGALKPCSTAQRRCSRSKSSRATTTTWVEDSARVMPRIKAVFRARAIRDTGYVGVPGLAAKMAGQARQRCARACGLATIATGHVARAAPEGEGGDDRRGATTARLEGAALVSFLAPVRVAQLMVITKTPFRFRTKRNLWPYAGLAVVKHSSANQELRTGNCSEARRCR